MLFRPRSLAAAAPERHAPGTCRQPSPFIDHEDQLAWRRWSTAFRHNLSDAQIATLLNTMRAQYGPQEWKDCRPR